MTKRACIFPAAAIVLIVAWAYVRFGTMPQAAGLLYGVKPVIIAVVLQALWVDKGFFSRNRRFRRAYSSLEP